MSSSDADALIAAFKQLAASRLFDASQIDQMQKYTRENHSQHQNLLSSIAHAAQEQHLVSSTHGVCNAESANIMAYFVQILVLHILAKETSAPPPRQIEKPPPVTVPASSLSLTSMTPDELAKHLISRLGEQKTQLPYFKSLASKLGPSGVLEVLDETNAAMAPGGDESTKTVQDGKDERLRTGGGVFIKKAKAWIKRAEVKEKTVVEQTKVASFQLRGYQEEAIEKIMELNRATPQRNLVICAPTNSGKTRIFIEASRRLLQLNPQAKIVVLVPTLALVSQQCSAYRAAGFGGEESNEFHSTTLSSQEALFKKQHRVDFFCGAKQLKADQWLNELSRLSVMVIESGSFRNLLEDPKKRVCLSHINLLIFDECHHCKDDHPYAVALKHYNKLLRVSGSSMGDPFLPLTPPAPAITPPAPAITPPAPASITTSTSSLDPWKVRVKLVRPQGSELMMTRESADEVEGGEIKREANPPRRPHLLGFSATPAGGSSDQIVRSNLSAFLSSLSADLHIISDDRVKDIAPPPVEEKEEVKARPVDESLIKTLEEILSKAAMTLGLELSNLADSLEGISDDLEMMKTKEAIDESLVTLRRIVLASQVIATSRGQQQVNELNKWANELNRLSKIWHKEGMKLGLSIFYLVRSCINVNVDMGRECCLHLMAKKMIAIATKAARLTDHDARGNGGEGVGVTSMELDDGGALPFSSSSDSPGSDDADDHDDNDDDKGEKDSSLELKAISDRVRQEMMRKSLALGQSLSSSSLTLPPPIHDFKGQAIIDLCRSIIHEVFSPIDKTNSPDLSMSTPRPPSQSQYCSLVPELSLFAPGLLPSLLASSPSIFPPKVNALTHYLLRHKDKADFRGIIFTRTIQGAAMLHSILSIARLPFVDSIDLFTGHGGNSSQNQISSESHPGLHQSHPGMTSKGQTAILTRFKSNGRRLLVATTAAEEGIDCPGCEFVVRFSAPASGIQRIQSKGRGRKLGSVFFNIVLKTTVDSMDLDQRLDEKSRLEEEAMKRVLQETSPAPYM